MARDGVWNLPGEYNFEEGFAVKDSTRTGNCEFSVVLLLAILLFNPINSLAHQAQAAKEMAAAAQNFLQSLSDEQRQRASFSFAGEERFNFHFIPRDRRGISFKALESAQAHLAYGLLASGLSQKGYLQATTIMSLEQILHDLEAGRSSQSWRDPELYYFSIFGNPGQAESWGWRVEGHHLSVNFTIVGGLSISATPSFFGSNPAIVRDGPRKGLQVLADEQNLGRALAESLTPEQAAEAILAGEAPADILTGAQRQIQPLQPGGVAYEDLNETQKQLFHRLVENYIRRHRPEVAEDDLQKIESAGWNQVHFAWVGSLEAGQGHYYRIQGPTFLIEYDNTQNGANHVHSVYREFNGDFGEDLLKAHYRNSPHHEAGK